MDSEDPSRRRVFAAAEFGMFALLSYLPFLLSSPGRIASDSKQGLYVDPGRFLADATHLWDPGIAAGTVTHQHIGYLWPMGPWFRLLEAVGLPTWIAQRFWLGTLTLLAALGARWLIRSLGFGRAAAIAGALVYAFTPYQLAFTARASVLLLPWVGLPWLVELTRRALARGGWRHPALFALVATTVAGVNAPTLLLVGVAPLTVLLLAAVRGRVRDAAAVAGRIAVLGLLTGAWWFLALLVQSRHGIDVLAVTEDLRATSSRSSPDDVLRGLGNWFFYGGDLAGPHVVQAPFYDRRGIWTLLSLVLPALLLLSAAVVRWRGRVLTVLLLGSTVLAVGPWPYDDPSLLGRMFRRIGDRSSIGFAFRNSNRIVPVLVLGLALAAAAAIRAMPRPRRVPAAGAIGLLALATLAPVLRVGMLSEPVERPGELPAYWIDAAAHLDHGDPSLRVLELPGANFAAYRWGNAIEPVTPLLTSRPHLAREVLPYGSPESALLLDAIDRRLQNGVLDPASVAPVARLFGVGDLVIRTDLAAERFGLRSPLTTWAELVGTPVPGFGEPVSFGPPIADPPGGRLDPLLPSDLRDDAFDRRTGRAPVTVLPLEDPRPVVHVAPLDGSILLDGDADGIVDAASAGIVDGRTSVLLAGSLDEDEIRDAAQDGAQLVVTDSHRRRIQTWFTSIRHTRGPTERAGETLAEPSGHDARLPSFPAAADPDRSVAEQIGATVTATSAGGGAARPEDRPMAAFDGRAGTSWRVGGADPTGQRLDVDLESVRTVDRIRLLQPQDGPRDRIVTGVRIHLEGRDPIEVELDGSSLEPPGQLVPLPATSTGTVGIEIAATSNPPMPPEFANAVGFAEVDVPGLTVEETVRTPRRLLSGLGPTSLDHPLALVLTRLRSAPDDWTRGDEEPTLDRRIDAPVARSFHLSGSARIAERAPDSAIDELLGTAGPITVTSSGRLQGAPGSRGSRVLDGSDETAWTSAFGRDGDEWLDFDLPDTTSSPELEIALRHDDRHSIPGRIEIRVPSGGGWRTVGSADVVIGDETADGITRVTVPVDADVEADRLRVIFTDISELAATRPDPDGSRLPISVVEVGGLDGIRPEGEPVEARAIPDPACRSDLLLVDDEPVPVRLGRFDEGGTASIEACSDVDLSSGRVRIRSTDEGILDVDSLLLRSDAGGAAAGSDTIAPPPDATGAELVRVRQDRTEVEATVRTDGEPFRFVLGQSFEDGWRLRVTGGQHGENTLVDGYADSWSIIPDAAGEIIISATWAPQRTVRAGMAVSVLGAVLCLAIVLVTGRGRSRSPVPVSDLGPVSLVDPAESASSPLPRVLAGSIPVFVGVAMFSRWWIGLVAAVAAGIVGRRPAAAWAAGISAAGALVAARFLRQPELGWLALALVIAAVVGDSGRSGRTGRSSGAGDEGDG